MLERRTLGVTDYRMAFGLYATLASAGQAIQTQPMLREIPCCPGIGLHLSMGIIRRYLLCIYQLSFLRQLHFCAPLAKPGEEFALFLLARSPNLRYVRLETHKQKGR